MTTAQRSSRNRTLAGLTAAIALLSCTQASAHRRDEYLQAARIAIAPARVDIELDLTPGIALASNVARRDRSRSRRQRCRQRGRRVRRTRPRRNQAGSRWPADAARVGRTPISDCVGYVKGEGTIQIRLSAAVPPLAAGGHRVLYRNDHRPDIAAYLANALVPASDRVTVQAQRRSVDQRDLVIEYALDAAATTGWSWWLAACLGGVTAIVAALGLRRSGTARGSVPI
jgi:hypothetical protein